ncbi:hypothetical protein QBC37DRAFT_380664 [Rhypophila decipiens]|uniref:Ferric oxidoreductase domain-containing protein n=1 Tax=Rhypophila decipiens TaxID=261697 RepID=A0AAN6XUI4_9PEZI|nr:hypothetical protein QBC37DRAFT_380664 [Rhypophila decipiens]
MAAAELTELNVVVTGFSSWRSYAPLPNISINTSWQIASSLPRVIFRHDSDKPNIRIVTYPTPIKTSWQTARETVPVLWAGKKADYGIYVVPDPPRHSPSTPWSTSAWTTRPTRRLLRPLRITYQRRARRTLLAADVYSVQYNGDTPQTASPVPPRPRAGPSNATIFSIVLVLTLILLPILLSILPKFLSSSSGILQVPESTINDTCRKFSCLKNQLLTPLPPTNLLPRRFTTAIGNPPTKGITLYLILVAALTLVLTLIKPGYKTPSISSPALATNPILTYTFQRTGTYAFALLPVVILFSSRNNLLLLLAARLPFAQPVSHSTYLLLHRWIGRLFAVLAIIHSILAIPLYLSKLPSISHQRFWIWGSVATVSSALLVVLGVVYFRRRFYEPFLLGHILLSIIVLVGCWYHVQDLMPSGIATCAGWVIAAVAVWGFDRLVRTARVVRNGVHRAKVSELGENGEYARVDIPLDLQVTRAKWGGKRMTSHSRPGLHVYAQFPNLDGWKRPWENHPFSVVPTGLLLSRSEKEGDSEPSGSSSPTDGGSILVKGPDGDAEKGTSAEFPPLANLEQSGQSSVNLVAVQYLVEAERAAHNNRADRLRVVKATAGYYIVCGHMGNRNAPWFEHGS